MPLLAACLLPLLLLALAWLVLRIARPDPPFEGHYWRAYLSSGCLNIITSEGTFTFPNWEAFSRWNEAAASPERDESTVVYHTLEADTRWGRGGR